MPYGRACVLEGLRSSSPSQHRYPVQLWPSAAVGLPMASTAEQMRFESCQVSISLPSRNRCSVNVTAVQGTSQWILRAANGFNGALADPYGNAALILSGKGCKPVNITSASGIPVTSLTHTYKCACQTPETCCNILCSNQAPVSQLLMHAAYLFGFPQTDISWMTLPSSGPQSGAMDSAGVFRPARSWM